MEAVRVGFVGAGNSARRHIRRLQRFEDVRIVAISDLIYERAQAAATQCGGKAYRDYERMITVEKPDALYICVPPFAHGAIEILAIECRVPFFVEKPLAIGLDVALSIDERVRTADLITSVGYQWRYLDTTEHARKLLSTNPARLVLGYWLDAAPSNSWWSLEAESGGQIIEQTTHIFDLVRLLVGEVTNVSAIGSCSDGDRGSSKCLHDASVVSLKFASGAIGTIASTCLLKRPHRIGVHLFCDGVALELSSTRLTISAEKDEKQVAAQVDPYEREDRDFIDTVRGLSLETRVPYSEALLTHRLATTAVRSMSEDRRIDL
jgi:predicted dehydrogenase